MKDNINKMVLDICDQLGIVQTGKYINHVLETHLEFNITVYAILHKIRPRFHIGIYYGENVKDMHFHYANTLGSGTIGDAIRKEGTYHFTFKTIGKFSDLNQAIEVAKFYKKLYNRKQLKSYAQLDNEFKIKNQIL